MSRVSYLSGLQQAFSSSGAELISERTGRVVALTSRPLKEHSDEDLSAFDDLIVAPFGTANQLYPQVHALPDSNEAHEVDQTLPDLHFHQPCTATLHELQTEEKPAGTGAPSTSESVVSVVHGKATYVVPLSGLTTVLDLKRALEALTDIPFIRQKLMSKGKLLSDAI